MNILLMYLIALLGLTKSRTVLCESVHNYDCIIANPKHFISAIFPIIGVQAANLTIELTTLEGEVCPTVQFTCTIEDLAALRWFINGSNIASYIYTAGDTFPFPLSSPPGIEISVTSAAPDSVDLNLLDATSTLTTNTTVFQAFNMQNFTCGIFGTMSEPVTENFNILGKQCNNNSPILSIPLLTPDEDWR